MWEDSGYAYAKASWIIGKSFLGKKVSMLSNIHTLNELDRLIFPDGHRELPGRELLNDLEARIRERSKRQITSVVNSYTHTPKLLSCMLKENTGFNFYQELIDSLSQLENEDRQGAARLLADEISLGNCAWAIRLRSFYNKDEKEIKKYILDLKLLGNIHQRRASLAAEANASLDFSLDVREDWHGWRWEKFLNAQDGQQHWNADPRHFQNAASQYLYRLAFHSFHSSSMSVSAIYCFIKLKQYEEDLLTSVAEGFSLGMNSAGVFNLLEAAV